MKAFKNSWLAHMSDDIFLDFLSTIYLFEKKVENNSTILFRKKKTFFADSLVSSLKWNLETVKGECFCGILILKNRKRGPLIMRFTALYCVGVTEFKN